MERRKTLAHKILEASGRKRKKTEMKLTQRRGKKRLLAWGQKPKERQCPSHKSTCAMAKSPYTSFVKKGIFIYI